MKRLSLGPYALSLSMAALLPSGCGGSQLPVAPAPASVNPFHRGTIQSPAGAAVAYGTRRVSPDGIVYARADVRIASSQYNLDLNGDGTTDFVITESNTTSKPRCSQQRHGLNEFGSLAVTGQGSNAFEASTDLVTKLHGNSPIGASQSFASGSGKMEARSLVWEYVGPVCEPDYFASGNWAPRNRAGYVGFAFLIRGKTHYGWAKFTVTGPGPGYGAYLYATLTSYAYQTKAGKSIMAGQR